uniref:EamA family transporter n=1 Tax=Candidatus Entotheonella palauensis TaxID=93172 RepID=UPI000B7F01DF
MQLWVWLTLGTVFAQTARNAIARSMVEEVSAPLNSWSRFAFMLPWLFPLVMFFVMRSGMPHVSPSCLVYAVFAAGFQLTGGVMLIMAFQHSNFAQSVIFHKLGVVFVAVIGVLFFQESPSLLAWLGILLCSVGIVLMNIGRDLGPSGWRQAFHLDRGGVLSVMCALLLAFFNFTAKRSLQILVQDNPHLQESFFESLVLICFLVTALDAVILTIYLLLRHPGQFRHVRRLLPRMVMAGTASLANALMWFGAVSLTLVAYVSAVSQIES